MYVCEEFNARKFINFYDNRSKINVTKKGS